MNKPRAYKFLSLMLAILLLLSAFSFKVETALCSTQLSKGTVTAEVAPCCKGAVRNSYDFLQNSCCQNKIIKVQGLNQIQVILDSFEFPSLGLFKTDSKTAICCDDFQTKVAVIYCHYTPPDLAVDSQVAYQLFLI